MNTEVSKNTNGFTNGNDKKSKKIRPEGAEDNSEKVPETISPFPTIEEFGGELQNSRNKLNFFLFQIKPNNCK